MENKAMNQTTPAASPANFTEEDIRAAYAKTRTGADFPKLIQDLKNLGIVSYDHMLDTGSNIFRSRGEYSLSVDEMGPPVPVSDQPDSELLKKYISEHQRGLTNYAQICALAGQVGVQKWTCDFYAMTCTYFDKAGRTMLVEPIPVGEYKK
jgi:uncharacterized protein YbcV (DUF1398 family)